MVLDLVIPHDSLSSLIHLRAFKYFFFPACLQWGFVQNLPRLHFLELEICFHWAFHFNYYIFKIWIFFLFKATYSLFVVSYILSFCCFLFSIAIFKPVFYFYSSLFVSCFLVCFGNLKMWAVHFLWKIIYWLFLRPTQWEARENCISFYKCLGRGWKCLNQSRSTALNYNSHGVSLFRPPLVFLGHPDNKIWAAGTYKDCLFMVEIFICFSPQFQSSSPMGWKWE